MRRALNPKWIDGMNAEIAAHKEAIKAGTAPKAISITTACSQGVQWLILRLANEGIPYRLIMLGSGVKRITTDVEVCPKCNGTGRC